MKYRNRYLKKIPAALAADMNRVDELFDRMASKWAMRAEKSMREYRRDHMNRPTLANRRS